ncbi:nucleotidyltransferase family protein [Candidatus Dependentiae bacterium]|nr:nucleotidyltransferase family protein [Candidatus Dependentiae bacterium]
MKNNLSAIILSAGESSRMGSPKALLKIGETTFLEKIYKNLLICHFHEIIVLLGKDNDKIKLKFEKLLVKFIVNESYKQGQLSSIIKALDSVKEESEGIFLTLVDMPLVQSETMKILIEEWNSNKDKIIIPEYENRGGHPVIFPKKFFPELRAAPLEEGARFVVYNNKDKVIRVPVKDIGIRKDFDYPKDLDELDL